MSADKSDSVKCPRCQTVDRPGIPGRHLCSGFTPAPHRPLSAPARARVLAVMDDSARCRARAAVAARSAVIG